MKHMGTKREKSPKHGLTCAKDLTIMPSEHSRPINQLFGRGICKNIFSRHKCVILNRQCCKGFIIIYQEK